MSNVTIGLFAINSHACAEPEAAARIATRAESLGYDSLWAGEHVVVPSPRVEPSPMEPDEPILDPLIALAHLAGHTERILLGTGLIVLPQRNPLVLAKQAASLDVLSGGRLILGIGVGYLEPEMTAIGVPMQARGARADEYLAAMRSLWEDDAPAHHGDYVDFEGVDAHPRPVQRPLPIVVGGHTEVAFRRAARYADGWYGFLVGLRAMRKRRQVDERFDPDEALAGAVRYLKLARARFGREDLAVVSYHMGMGNLENVLDAYGDDQASWARVYFDATPRNHPRAYGLLSGFGDDSATYLWRVYAAREIMRVYRENRAELRRRATLQTAKASAEEVLHPPSETKIYESPGDLEDGYRSGELRPFEGIRGMRLDRQDGELAARLDADRDLYRGLRPEAYELAVYLAAGVRSVSGTRASLDVTSTVRDLEYQRLLVRDNPFATREYSLHTAGFAFDVRRDYASRAQAVAFQYMLDRLQSLNLIAWIREPGAIHITASGEDVLQ